MCCDEVALWRRTWCVNRATTNRWWNKFSTFFVIKFNRLVVAPRVPNTSFTSPEGCQSGALVRWLLNFSSGFFFLRCFTCGGWKQGQESCLQSLAWPGSRLQERSLYSEGCPLTDCQTVTVHLLWRNLPPLIISIFVWRNPVNAENVLKSKCDTEPQRHSQLWPRWTFSFAVIVGRTFASMKLPVCW